MESDTTWVEKVIKEIQSKPAIYDKSLPGYIDKEAKNKCWNEVFEALIDDWPTLSAEEKLRRGNEVRQRWRNLKCCFQRELRVQKKVPFDHSSTKRRKYIYYDQLQFLLPTVNYQLNERRNSSETQAPTHDEVGETSVQEDDVPLSTSRPKKKAVSYEESLLNILQSKNEEVDEDKLFLLSLLPSMKRLNRDLKWQAKIELIKTMNNFEIANDRSNIVLAPPCIKPSIDSD